MASGRGRATVSIGRCRFVVDAGPRGRRSMTFPWTGFRILGKLAGMTPREVDALVRRCPHRMIGCGQPARCWSRPRSVRPANDDVAAAPPPATDRRRPCRIEGQGRRTVHHPSRPPRRCATPRLDASRRVSGRQTMAGPRSCFRSTSSPAARASWADPRSRARLPANMQANPVLPDRNRFPLSGLAEGVWAGRRSSSQRPAAAGP